MTSEIEALKTNEFLRRRKLRIQQVREQSKDIAKKIRQRTTAEKYRYLVSTDEAKEREYVQQQDKLVKKLEDLYTRGLDNVGASHRNAAELCQREEKQKRSDLSKQRGREAAAKLRQKKQEQLDERKKLLDRKLQARDVANEISREKSSSVIAKFSKPSVVRISEETNSKTENDSDKPTTLEIPEGVKETSESSKTNMATQWDYESLPKEWEPHVPALKLPNDDNVAEASHKNNENKPEKSKRLNLFALSDEMPSSLRGGLQTVPEEPLSTKQSLTLVSDYIQNRNLRLRESDTATSSKKQSGDLQSLKQTILQTRNSKVEGSSFNPVCHVADVQVVPVPSWQAENKCGPYEMGYYESYFHSTSNYPSDRHLQNHIQPSPVLRGCSPFRRNKVCRKASNRSNIEKGNKLFLPESALNKKSAVKMYNHSTRDVLNVPCAYRELVSRDMRSEEDAYSQAMRESSSLDISKDKEQLKKIRQMRSKVAVSKQNVEKEYKDTMEFLKSLPKDKSKPIKKAYKNDEQQQMERELLQRKLQLEFKKIQRESSKQSKMILRSSSYDKSKSRREPAEDFDARDLQYSWMPVPESDGSLAIHTIPTTLKEHKSGNIVKFSKIDGYHEYRSRHKHTPPTKDTPAQDRRKFFETTDIEEENIESDSSSDDSSSGVETPENTDKKSSGDENDQNLSQRIVIYKVLDKEANKKDKGDKKSPLLRNVARSMSSIRRENHSYQGNGESGQTDKIKKSGRRVCKSADNNASLGNLREGVYKAVNEEVDNIAALYYSNQLPDEVELRLETGDNSRAQKCGAGTNACHKKCKKKSRHQPSTATSTSSFKTADKGTGPEMCTDVVVETNKTSEPSDDRVDLLNPVENRESLEKLCISANFLKDDAYEVIIQLRKKNAMHIVTKEALNKEDEKSPNVNENQNVNPTNIQENLCDRNETLPLDKNQPITVAEPLITEQTQEDNNILTNQNSSLEIYSKSSVTKGTSNQNVSMSDKNEQIICNAEVYNTQGFPQSNLVDKGVVTNIQDLTKPTNSVSIQTQTSIESPPPRPMYVHMSSSTSTAYLSPPELVMPAFLREDYRSNRNQNNSSDFNDTRVKSMNNEHSPKTYIKNCSHVRKKATDKSKALGVVLKASPTQNKSKTPPNTARTVSSLRHSCESHKKKGIFVHSYLERPVKKCTKCARLKLKNCTKIKSPIASRSLLNRYLSATSTLSKNKLGKVPSVTRNAKNMPIKQEKCYKPQLSPVIKWYVNKLLALNKEGLKAINIVNEDCSTVTTPGSSVIDVPNNIDMNKATVEPKISLQQIKEAIIHQMLDKIGNDCPRKDEIIGDSGININKVQRKHFTRLPKKKSLHKVKSLYVSKNLSNGSPCPLEPSSGTTSSRDYSVYRTQTRSKSSPSRRTGIDNELKERFEKLHSYFKITKTSTEEMTDGVKASPEGISEEGPTEVNNEKDSKVFRILKSTPTQSRTSLVASTDLRQTYEAQPNTYFQSTKISTEEKNDEVKMLTEDIPKEDNTVINNEEDLKVFRILKSTPPQSCAAAASSTDLKQQQSSCVPLNISTQTSRVIDEEINFMKLAEDKLQNMEKIADLTEKCTKRLSNLAKVLDEVRRNKSIPYSQGSDDVSDSDRASAKISDQQLPISGYEPKIEINEKNKNMEQLTTSTTPSSTLGVEEDIIYPTDMSNNAETANATTDTSKPQRPQSPADKRTVTNMFQVRSPNITNSENHNTKSRGKPPPALSRRCLKRTPDYIAPHELSTVVEVDSPQLKNQPNDGPQCELTNTGSKNIEGEHKNEKQINNPDLLQNNQHLTCEPTQISSTDSSDDTKMQMMDLKKFNEIMLKPFISIQEYAKQCKVGALKDTSNIETVPKENIINDDLSSLHSDGSLPDVIAELLKRNIISEPFKFDTASNVNSTTISSESTFSGLALSKAKHEKRKPNNQYIKENIAESSDTLSISSNPDLESAFKKLGMGWASSTLKKTKERLALSSSSNSSTSSISQFKLKTANNQECPAALEADSVSSVRNPTTNLSRTISRDSFINAEQQTSLMNSMTVKQFLTNELAKRITFTNKSYNSKDDTAEEEFISLYETKMPEGMKRASKVVCEERSGDSNTRARTSTPVPIFKSLTYHSSSSSNISNGLFSNADDLSSVKGTSNSQRNHSTSDKDDLTIPNFSLRKRKGLSDTKSD